MRHIPAVSAVLMGLVLGGCVVVDDGYGYGTTETVYYEESYYTPGNTVIYHDVYTPLPPAYVVAPPPVHHYHHGPGLHVRPDHRPPGHPGHGPDHRPPGHGPDHRPPGHGPDHRPPGNHGPGLGHGPSGNHGSHGHLHPINPGSGHHGPSGRPGTGHNGGASFSGGQRIRPDVGGSRINGGRPSMGSHGFGHSHGPHRR